MRSQRGCLEVSLRCDIRRPRCAGRQQIAGNGFNRSLSLERLGSEVPAHRCSILLNILAAQTSSEFCVRNWNGFVADRLPCESPSPPELQQQQHQQQQQQQQPKTRLTSCELNPTNGFAATDCFHPVDVVEHSKQIRIKDGTLYQASETNPENEAMPAQQCKEPQRAEQTPHGICCICVFHCRRSSHGNRMNKARADMAIQLTSSRLSA